MQTLELKTESLSVITGALEQAHEIIKNETGAPRATILVTRALKGRHAHFTPYTPWSNGEESFNEIAFNAESFQLGATHLLGSLLHEVAHSINHANGIEDCSSNQYHNAHFAKTAKSLGLNTEEIKGKGQAKTALSDDGILRWSIALAVIEEALKITALDITGSKKPKSRNTNLLKAECECGNSIRASRGVIVSGVTCDECETNFQIAE